MMFDSLRRVATFGQSLLIDSFAMTPTTQETEPEVGVPGDTPAQWQRTLAELPHYSLMEVAEHNLPHDCWLVIADRVYDVTDFLATHPGGEYIVMEHAGQDATTAFRVTRHGQDAYDMLKKYLIGVLPPCERLYIPSSDSLLE